MSTTTSPGLYQIKVGPRTFYYGQSQNLRKRGYYHLYGLRKGTHKNPRLQASFNKHGEAAFSFTTLLICEIEELNRYEQALLDAHHGTPGCANIAKDAEASARGLKRSDEVRAKMGESSRAHQARPEYREMRSKMSKAYWADPESRRKASEAAKARLACPEAYKKQGESAKKPIEVTWTSGETTIFPSGKATGEYLGLKDGQSITEWLAGRLKIPKKHGILSVRKL